MIIDTHAHLTKEVYKRDLKNIIKNFPNENLDKVFAIGCDLKSSKESLKLAKKYNHIYAVIGVHPSYIKTLNKKTLKWLEKNAAHPKVIAIGEIGIDYHWTREFENLQFDGFLQQLELAHKVGLPIVIHTRDSSDDLIKFLTKHKHLLTNGGIVHCFGDDLAFFEKVKSLGLIISVGGVVTYKNAKNIQDAVKDIPLTHIVLETDSPYLAPMPHRGKTNYPKYTNLVAEKIAELKNISLQEVEATTTKNVYALFKKLK